MAEQGNKTMPKRRRWLRALLYALAGVVLLLAIAVAITQTQWFRDFLRDKIVDQANQTLNGTLSIGSIKGNLFSRIELDDVLLVQGSDTVIAMPRLTAAYDLWSFLQGAVIIDSLRIDAPSFHLRQAADSTWNIANLAQPDTSAAREADAASTGLSVVVGQFRLVGGRVQITSADSLIPTSLDAINLQAYATWTDPQAVVHVDDLRFISKEPSVELQGLRASVLMDDIGIRVDSLVAQTRSNRIEASGYYQLGADLAGRLTVNAPRFDASEFAAFIPLQLPQVRPMLALEAAAGNDTASLNIDLREGQRFLTLAGRLDGMSALLMDSTSQPPTYDANIEFDLAGIDQWLPDTLITGDAQGTVHVSGTSLDPDRAAIDARLRLANGSVYTRKIDSIRLDGVYAADTANVQLRVQKSTSVIAVEGKVTGVMDAPAYDADIRMRRVDLAKLTGGDLPGTDLNLSAHVEGRGINLADLSARSRIVMSSSRVADFRLDTLYGEIAYGNDIVQIDTLWLVSDAVDLHAGGTLGIDRAGELTIAASIADISPFAELSGAERLGGAVSFKGAVEGRLDSLAASGRIELHQLVYDDYQVNESNTDLSVTYIDSVLSGEYSADLRGIVADEMTVASVSAQGRLSTDLVTGTVHVTVDEGLSGDLRADYYLDSIPRVDISDINLGIGSETWTSLDDTARLVLYPDRYEISNIRLRQPTALGATPLVTSDGSYYTDSTHQFRVHAEHVGIASLTKAFAMDVEAEGSLYADIESAGAIENPEVHGQTRLTSARINEYAFDSLAGSFNLKDSVLDLDYSLHVQGPESLTVAGYLPFAFVSDSAAPPIGAMDLRMRSYGFTMRILRLFGYTVENAEGDLQIDLRAYNTLADPRISGAVTIANGRVAMPSYGVDYRGIAGTLRFDSASATLEKLVAQRDDGRLTLSGRAAFDEGIVSGQVNAAELRLQANKFYVVRQRHYEVQLSADATVAGSVDSSRYGGTITVQRSSFFLPAFTGGTAAGEDAALTTVPMLVAALRDSSIVVEAAPIEETAPADTLAARQAEFLRNLRGRLSVRFPRNTWLRDKDMRVEIGGEIEIVKDDAEFEVFGTINVIRGHYELYGKRFTIREGTLTFNGGKEVNPGLDIDAVYVFRTPSREKKRLLLAISGNALSPVLEFSLDDQQLSEGDALSYIVFGRSLGELTSGQRSAIASESGSKSEMAKGAIGHLLAGKLSETLGKEFNLDVIEIEAQSDWKSASLVVGKYLTTDLFVSYQRGIGTARDQDELVPEIVTLEYELSRHIFLQLVTADARNSGFDVIVKFSRW
jgi:translocation and assembly module TamB